MDLERTPPYATPALRSLAAKVHVRADARLQNWYPKSWPARVIVERSGKRQTAFVSNPRGDFRNPIDWDDVLAKSARYRTLLTRIRTANLQEPIPRQLLEALKNPSTQLRKAQC